MTVLETYKVCQALLACGYFDYEMTCENGYQVMDTYPNYIAHKKQEINMEGYQGDGVKDEEVLKLRKAMDEVLKC